MTDTYRKEDDNKRAVEKDEDVTQIRNELYTIQNLDSELESLGTTDEVIQITVPEGEHVAYVQGETEEDIQLILRRNAAYRIEGSKTRVVLKTRYHNVWKATLVKEDVEKKNVIPKEEKKEQKIKTTLEGIAVDKGKDAVQNSGLVASHVEKFKEIAKNKQTYILFRPVNKLSTSLIAEGAATKGMNVHGKSSDWGPMAGYIPFDADLSKKHGSEKDVKKGNNDNTHSIAENIGVIDKIQLSISDARIKELKDENIIKDTKSDNRYDVFDLNKNADVYEFRRERNSGKVEYKTQNGKKSIMGNEITDWKPLEVMGKIVDQQTKPLTADYDMFGLAPTLEMIRDKIPKEKLEAALNKTEILDQVGALTNLLREYGLERSADPEKGKLTDWQKDMIDTLNKAAREAGYTGGTVVNHGTEQDNTEFPEQDKEIFIITPDGETVLTKSWADLQTFIQKNIVEKGLLYYFNRSYHKVAGGNKAKIEWIDPLTQAKIYTIPTERELFQEIASIKETTNKFLPKSFFEDTSTLNELSKTLSAYYNPASRFVEMQGESKIDVSLFFGARAVYQIDQIIKKGRTETPNAKEDFHAYQGYFEKLRSRIFNQMDILQTDKGDLEELLQQIVDRPNTSNQPRESVEDTIKQFLKTKGLEPHLNIDEKMTDTYKKVDENKKYTEELNKKLNLNHNIIQFDAKGDLASAYQEAKKMVERISKIDKIILSKLQEKGIFIKLVNYPITETEEYKFLKGAIPRGWEGSVNAEGKQLTWDDVPGTGSTVNKPVVARIGYSIRGTGHNTINLELHETAHAIDRVVFSNISQTEWFQTAFHQDQKRFLPDKYFEHIEEYFAECFSYYYFSEESKKELHENAPSTYMRIESLIKTIQENPDYFNPKIGS
ncbi:anthrax toxin-like adenylyl cyclase domain-containing protein [Bacillus cereus]|uniref:anthrax toxin-like adenylyl cyclase domain-containing protein n=1 Tax=Bacillus cereus TaxID=1396 RepID=UPI003EDF480C